MKNKINKLKEKGFTLIELLVVIAIIGILAGILFVAINPKEQTDKAIDAKRVKLFNAIDKALNLYYLDHGYYPKMRTANYGSNGTNESAFQDSLKLYLNFNIKKEFGRYGTDDGAVEFLYKSSGDYSKYGVALVFSDIGSKYSDSDGGYFSGWWEKGTAPIYCMKKYTGDNRDWWNGGDVCKGGN